MRIFQNPKQSILTIMCGVTALLASQSTQAQLYSSGNQSISGNKVGIGVSSPKATLHLKDFTTNLAGSSTVPMLRFQSTDLNLNPQPIYKWDINMNNSSNLTFWQSTGSNTPAVAMAMTPSYVKIYSKIKVGEYQQYGGGLTPDNTQGFHMSLGLRELNSGIWQGKGAALFTTSSGEFQLMTYHNTGVLNGVIGLDSNVRLTANNKGIGINGSLRINTPNDNGYELAVNGDAIFNKVVVKSYGNWPDFVFGDTYQLRSLQEVKNYITVNKHLPEVPSAKEVEENGIDMYEINKALLQKVEELTLYLIDLEERVLKMESIK